MFVLLFAYVFGGAIDVPGGGSYREFLMGGIFAQTIVFSAFGVAMSHRQRPQEPGRRPIPVAAHRQRGGAGRSCGGELAEGPAAHRADVAVRLAVGWRIRSGFLDAVGGVPAVDRLRFRHDLGGRLLGSLVRTPEGVTGIAFTALFPVTFIASTFVPSSTMPTVLRTIAEWNPTTSLADALRVQFGNPNTPLQPDDPWSIAHPGAYTWIWIVAIIAVCAPLAIRAYQRSISRSTASLSRGR